MALKTGIAELDKAIAIEGGIIALRSADRRLLDERCESLLWRNPKRTLVLQFSDYHGATGRSISTGWPLRQGGAAAMWTPFWTMRISCVCSAATESRCRATGTGNSPPATISRL